MHTYQSYYDITTIIIYTFTLISTECPADAISTRDDDPHYDTIDHTVFDPLIPITTPITLDTLHSYVQRISQDSTMCKKCFEVKNV